MNRLSAVTGSVIICCVLPAFSHAAGPPWYDLRFWVGRYPTIQEAGHTRRLWEQPVVQTSLRTLLSQADLKRLDSIFAVSKRIVQIGHFIVVEECLPHNCPSAHAIVVFDTQERLTWVGFYERTKDAVSTRWYGSEDYTLLPGAILERFRRDHTAW